jgi:hypothetical protein
MKENAKAQDETVKYRLEKEEINLTAVYLQLKKTTYIYCQQTQY